MKIVSGQNQPLCRASAFVGLALVVGVLIFAGCSKTKVPAAETSAPESVQPAGTDHPAAAGTTAAAAPAVVAAPTGEPDLKDLDRSLLRWILKNRRRPASFEDFAATAGVAIPPAPAGKKYVLAKNMHIQLVAK